MPSTNKTTSISTNQPIRFKKRGTPSDCTIDEQIDNLEWLKLEYSNTLKRLKVRDLTSDQVKTRKRKNNEIAQLEYRITKRIAGARQAQSRSELKKNLLAFLRTTREETSVEEQVKILAALGEPREQIEEFQR